MGMKPQNPDVVRFNSLVTNVALIVKHLAERKKRAVNAFQALTKIHILP